MPVALVFQGIRARFVLFLQAGTIRSLLEKKGGGLRIQCERYAKLIYYITTAVNYLPSTPGQRIC